MLFSTLFELSKRKEAELIVLPFWKLQKGPKAAAVFGDLQKKVLAPIETKDFSGKEGE